MSERMPDYAQGFKDGFAAGLEEGKKLATKPSINDYVFGSPNTCSVCGRYQSGIDMYNCFNTMCPRVDVAYGQVFGGPQGSSYVPPLNDGANGPAGPSMSGPKGPWDPTYDDSMHVGFNSSYK